MKKLTIIFFILAMYNSFGQGNRNKIPSYFGVQVKPILPTNFIGDKILDLNSNGFQSTTTQRMGYSFGGVVRAGITKLIAFETGINFNQRYFDIAMSVPDSGLYMSSRLGFIEYDIPINALMYIRLADKWFMNASLGFVIDFKPTDVQVIEGDGYNFFYHTGVANNKFGIGMNANLGFEFRTDNAGIFYLGGSARVPFFPLFGMIADYRYQGFNERIIGEVDGSFLSLDLKYFFPNIANKGIQPIESPID